MSSLDLRPLAIGELFDRAFMLYRRHFPQQGLQAVMAREAGAPAASAGPDLASLGAALAFLATCSPTSRDGSRTSGSGPAPRPRTTAPRSDSGRAGRDRGGRAAGGRAEQAAACGDKGLATHLETIVEDETSHFEETEKILRGW